MKNLVKPVLFLFISILLINIYVWGMSYSDWKKEKSRNLQEIYTDLGEYYQIGKYNKVNTICKKDKGCLDGKLKGISILSNDIYLYIEINIIESTLTYTDGTTKIGDYNYSLFVGDGVNNTITVKQKSDLPKYGLLSNNNLEFYSENELKNLPQEQVNIFKELEKNPIIKIYGKVY